MQKELADAPDFRNRFLSSCRLSQDFALLRARPKRLRLAALEERIALWKEALRLLPVAT